MLRWVVVGCAPCAVPKSLGSHMTTSACREIIAVVATTGSIAVNVHWLIVAIGYYTWEYVYYVGVYYLGAPRAGATHVGGSFRCLGALGGLLWGGLGYT